MTKSHNELLNDSRMLSIILQQTDNSQSLPYSDHEDLKCYLKNLLNKAKADQKNALKIHQNKQIEQNIKSQIQTMKRYIAK